MNKTLFINVLVALVLVFSVSAIGNLGITETSVALSGNPGATNSTQYITLSNSATFDMNGIVVNSTDLTGSSGIIPANAMTFFMANVNLPASSSYVDAIIFSIPSTQKAGTYTGTLAATYNTSHWDFASVTATVNPVYSFSFVADTPSIAKTLVGQINVQVTNTGNADLSGLTWKSSNPFVSGSNFLSPITTSGSLNVNYNSSANFSIPFSVPSSQAAGTYNGQVNVTQGSNTQILNVAVVVKDPVYSISMPEIQYDESSRGKNVSKTITIVNNGDFPITNIQALSTTAPNTTITSITPVSLSKGSSFTATLTTTIPNDVDSGIYKIGTLDFRSNELNRSVDVKTDTKSMLVFDTVKISIDDASFDSVNDGNTADDEARPGDTFEIKVRMENLFDDDDDDIEDVEVRARFYGAGEGGDEIDGDSEDFDVDAGDKSDEIEVDFDDDVIDWESDSGKLTVELWAEGTDESGVRHTANFTFKVDVDRESGAEFIFTRFDAASTVECGRTLTLYADGRSIGEDSDDEVEIKIDNSNLGISIREQFSMGAFDDDDCDAFDDNEDDCTEFNYRKSIQIPTGVSGTFNIVAKLYKDDGNKQTDEEDISVTVTCSSSSSSSSSGSTSGSTTTNSGSTSSGATTTPTTTGGSSGTTTATTPSTTTSTVQVLYGGSGQVATTSSDVTATSPTKIIDTTKSSSFRDSKAYLALLSILSVLLIIGIVVALVFAFSNPQD